MVRPGPDPDRPYPTTYQQQILAATAVHAVSETALSRLVVGLDACGRLGEVHTPLDIVLPVNGEPLSLH